MTMPDVREQVLADVRWRYPARNFSEEPPEVLDRAIVEEIWMSPRRYGIECAEDAGRVITTATRPVIQVLQATSLRPGDVIRRPPYGPCRIVGNTSSGSYLRKLTWLPVTDAWRVVNPPGLDYVRNETTFELIR